MTVPEGLFSVAGPSPSKYRPNDISIAKLVRSHSNLPSHNKKKQMFLQAKKRQSRGRLYLIGLIIIIILGIGVYVYASSLPPGPPDFALAAPRGVTINAGSPSTATVNITAINRFSGTVQLSATSSPAGLTTSISPANITGSGVATLTMSSATNGTYTVTLTATSGTLKHSVAPRVATAIYAKLVTSQGNVTVELFPAQTPQTVANFVNLSKSGFYTNLTWHRIVAGFVVQTGDPNTRNGAGDKTTWGQGGSGQSVPFEYDPSLHNSVGYLGMASTAAGTGGTSQFYVNVNDNSAALDGKYAVFGKVISGMNAVNALANLPTTAQYTNAQAPEPLVPANALLISVTISQTP